MSNNSPLDPPPSPVAVYYKNKGTANGHVVLQHSCDGKAVGGVLPDAIWTTTQIDPLTVVPSISCDNCGLHGFITDGQWVPV